MVVVRVLLHVLGEVHNLLRQDGHHDARRARVLVVLTPLELRGLPRQLVKVSLQKTKRRHHVEGHRGGNIVIKNTVVVSTQKQAVLAPVYAHCRTGGRRLPTTEQAHVSEKSQPGERIDHTARDGLKHKPVAEPR